MKHIFWLCCLLSILSISSSKAQDQANFTQFYLNPYLINPSFAGIDGQSALSLIYRRQWMGISDGPAIANVSLHTPINQRTAVGFSVTNDKKGLLNNTGLLITFGYNAQLGDFSYLRFGVSAGGAWNSLDIDKLGQVGNTSDPALINALGTNASITGNAGVSFHHKLFHIGVAMPTIFSPSYVSTDAFSITEVKPFQSIIVHASNRFYFNNNKNIFEPYAVYRVNMDLPAQFEFAGILHLNHMVWAGASYKQDFGISALGGIKLQNAVAIGGSYSIKNSGVNELNSSSFEVSLSFLFGQHKKGTHSYSFVNTVKEKEKKPTHNSASEAIAAKRKQEEAEKKKQLEAQAKAREDEAKRKQQEQAKAEADRKAASAQAEANRKAEEDRKKAEAKNTTQAKNNTEVKPPVVETPPPPKKDTVAITQAHNPRLRRDMVQTETVEDQIAHQQEQETLKRLELHADNPTEHHGDDPAVHANAERHEFVKRGNHAQELDVADYVIGGVFKADANAKHFADGLVKLGFKANYGHLTEKQLWYVYLIQTNDINEARKERDRVRKMKLLRDAWLLTVHH